MGKVIQDRIYRLKKATNLGGNLEFPDGQELHIVNDMVYVGGWPLPPELQDEVYTWITKNEKLFLIDERRR